MCLNQGRALDLFEPARAGAKSRRDRCGDAAPDVELAAHFHPHRFGHRDQIRKNLIRHIFVVVTLVAEAPQILLEGLQFIAMRPRRITHPNGREVRLAGRRAIAGELTRHALDLIQALRARIRKALDLLRGLSRLARFESAHGNGSQKRYHRAMLLSLLLLVAAIVPGIVPQPQDPLPSKPSPVQPGEASERGKPIDRERLPERGKIALRAAPVDMMMRNFMRDHGVPGAALAIVKDGKLVYARGFGWADAAKQVPVVPEARFRIASLSKPITAVVVLKLIEQGKLSLDTPAFALLGHQAALQSEGCDPRLGQITILQLLQHRAGWDRQVSFDPMFIPQRVQQRFGLKGPPNTKQIIRYMLEQPLDTDPGTHYAYSNFGYCVLGRVIETITGQSYADAVQSLLFDPLHLHSFALGRSLPEDRLAQEVWYQDRKQRTAAAVKAPDRQVPIGYRHDQEVLDAHGGWIASASELALFAAAFSNPKDSPILSANSIARMWQQPKESDGPVWYGCGWSVRQVKKDAQNAWHSGLLSGGTSCLLVRRHDGYTWAVLFNTDRSQKTDSVLSGLIDPLIHRAVNQVEEWTVQTRD